MHQGDIKAIEYVIESLSNQTIINIPADSGLATGADILSA